MNREPVVLVRTTDPLTDMATLHAALDLYEVIRRWSMSTMFTDADRELAERDLASVARLREGASVSVVESWRPDKRGEPQ